ncbi:MAG: hypothetical protein AYK19_02885 [Theionarchaea archaeon DG-70-1]|nr:MAG: hypothetical protein AYK19_02885 [Theionarchaea archaeon DG-70-1]
MVKPSFFIYWQWKGVHGKRTLPRAENSRTPIVFNPLGGTCSWELPSSPPSLHWYSPFLITCFINLSRPHTLYCREGVNFGGGSYFLIVYLINNFLTGKSCAYL